MKRTIVSYIFFSFCVLVFGQTSYFEGIRILNRSIEKSADRKVMIKMSLDFSGLDINRQHSLVIVPVIASQNGESELQLPSVVLNGKVRDKVNERVELLSDTMLYSHDATVIRRNNGTAQTLDYSTSVPFSRWMIGGELQLRGHVVGCASCGEGNEAMTTGNILPAMSPEYLADFIIPEDEAVKHRAENLNAYIQFRQDSHIIDPEYGNNRAEIDSVTNALRNAGGNEYINLTGIYITGYASPEGGYSYNTGLSERRVNSFTRYMMEDFENIDRSLFHVDWKGEDWKGFRAEVLDCQDLHKKDEVLSIIDNCTRDRDLCEKRIKELQPEGIYTRLLNEVYPMLRRNEIRLEYKVRNFDVSEGREIIFKDPQLLSVSEIHKVAESYGKGTPEYVSAMMAGAKGHPHEMTMLNNAALALIESGRPEEAVVLLKGASDNGILLNLMGRAYIDLGDTDAASECFKKSASMGFGDAETNLSILKEYLEYMAE